MKSIRFFILMFVAVAALTFDSCTPQRRLVYVNQGKPSVLANDSTTFTMLLLPGDFLQVELNTLNPEAFPGIGITPQREVITDNRTAYEKGFVIDKFGDVTLPFAGSIHLGGLSIKAAHDTVVEHFRKYIDDPDITLKKLSFKVTVLGEVARPNVFYVPNEQLTLLEALAMAGDLTNYADIQKLKIIRKSGNTTIQLMVDLTQRAAITGPTKYIYPDDIIYVPATRSKAFISISSEISVISHVITTMLLIMTLYIRIK